MSSISVSSGKENVIYLAFSTVIMSLFLKLFHPTLIDTDLRAAVSLVALGASLISSLFFYLKIDDLLVTSTIKRYVNINRKMIEAFSSRILLIIRPWETSIASLPLIAEETDNLIQTIHTESSLRNDIWILIGGGFFFFSLPAIGVLLDLGGYLSLLPTILMYLLGFSVIYRYRGFTDRVRYVLLSRYLEDSLQSDIGYRQTGNYPTQPQLNDESESWLQNHMKYKQDLLLNVVELNQLLDRKEWKRFEFRFISLQRAITNFTDRIIEEHLYSDLISDYIDAQFESITSMIGPSIIRYQNHKTVCEHLISFDSINELKNGDSIRTPCTWGAVVGSIHLSSLDARTIKKLAGYMNDTDCLVGISNVPSLCLNSWLETRVMPAGKEAIKNLIILFGHLEWKPRIQMMEVLGPHIDRYSFTYLPILVQDPNPDIRKMVALFLGFVTRSTVQDEAFILLRSLIAFDDSQILPEVIEALVKHIDMENSSIIKDILRSNLHHRNEEVKMTVLQSIMTISWDSKENSILVKQLIDLLGGANPGISLQATRVISKIAESDENEEILELNYPYIPRQYAAQHFDIDLEKTSETFSFHPNVLVEGITSQDVNQQEMIAANFLGAKNLKLDSGFARDELSALLNSGNRKAITIGLYVIIEGLIDFELNSEITKKIIDIMLENHFVQSTLAAIALSSIWSMTSNQVFRKTFSKSSSKNQGIALLIGCLGERVISDSFLLGVAVDYLVSDYLSIDQQAAITLGMIGHPLSDYPAIMDRLLELIGQAKGVHRMLLFEAAGKILTKEVNLEFLANTSDYRWSFETGMKAIKEIETRHRIMYEGTDASSK